jgi:hypothetical protein
MTSRRVGRPPASRLTGTDRMPKTSRQLYDDFIKLEWQDLFRTEVHVTLDSGSRYVPNGGSQGVQLLRPGVNAWDEAIRQWSVDLNPKNTSSAGYDRIVDPGSVSTSNLQNVVGGTRLGVRLGH